MSGSRFAVLAGFLLTVLSCIDASTRLTIKVIPPTPKAGDLVTLSVFGVQGTIHFATWYKGLSTSATEQILSHLGSRDIPGEKFFSEASGRPNGSLVIQDFRKEFYGDYTVQIQTSVTLQDGEVTVSGVSCAALSAFAPLFGLLLYSSISYL
ncbi:carcinoembryonic antigen-related cell adhesion molecule 5-like [Bufo bufo]|uniref:carcinoembryonic antigen-related cell adhesion molecule 5-like n=1 Tax=Bufo bufo TaxID=8384 RepID=UPI001ABE3DD9|nr:carcinoembryonic antigen-related cell adhesion molecule 5-like [Bufo bufo]